MLEMRQMIADAQGTDPRLALVSVKAPCSRRGGSQIGGDAQRCGRRTGTI